MPKFYLPRFALPALIGLAMLALMIAALTPVSAAPANDDLANAQVIPTGSSFVINGNDAGATQESFEMAPNYPLSFAKVTIWYSWTPSVSGEFDATSFHPSNGDYSLIGLFQGPGTPSASTYLASSPTSTGVFPLTAVTANQQYFIVVANVSGSPFTLMGSVRESAPQVPVATITVKQHEAIRSTGAPGRALIELSSAPAEDLQVHFKLGGTAIEGVDYKMISDTVTVPAGQTMAAIKIKPRARESDAVDVKLTLIPGDGYTIGQPKKCTIKIVNKP
jgi:hypothetical protein